jgi:hypothetical protein
MTKQRLLKLIKESRLLLAEATPEQKIKLLKLIKESYARLKENETQEELPYFLVEKEESQQSGLIESSQNQDYLEEK